MTNNHIYPLIITKGGDCLHIAAAPGSDMEFIGLYNGHVMARGTDTSKIFRTLMEQLAV